MATLVRVEKTEFLFPMFIGEVAHVSAEITYTSKHSLEVQVKVIAENILTGKSFVAALLAFNSCSTSKGFGYKKLLHFFSCSLTFHTSTKLITVNLDVFIKFLHHKAVFIFEESNICSRFHLLPHSCLHHCGEGKRMTVIQVLRFHKQTATHTHTATDTFLATNQKYHCNMETSTAILEYLLCSHNNLFYFL